jgi:hypothetical protein
LGIGVEISSDYPLPITITHHRKTDYCNNSFANESIAEWVVFIMFCRFGDFDGTAGGMEVGRAHSNA